MRYRTGRSSLQPLMRGHRESLQRKHFLLMYFFYFFYNPGQAETQAKTKTWKDNKCSKSGLVWHTPKHRSSVFEIFVFLTGFTTCISHLTMPQLPFLEVLLGSGPIRLFLRFNLRAICFHLLPHFCRWYFSWSFGLLCNCTEAMKSGEFRPQANTTVKAGTWAPDPLRMKDITKSQRHFRKSKYLPYT